MQPMLLILINDLIMNYLRRLNNLRIKINDMEIQGHTHLAQGSSIITPKFLA